MSGALHERLAELFRHPEGDLAPNRFDALAMEVFEAQFQGSESYRRFCVARGVTPETVERWEEIPLVPARAFKHLDLYSGSGEPEAVFRTSGTRGGDDARGRHPVPSLELYRHASMPWFGRHLVPDGARLPILSLVPEPDALPDSSLSTMMGFAVERWGTEGSGFFGDPEIGVDAPRFREALAGATAVGDPVLVMGTAFAWVQWLDHAAQEGWCVTLPEGSRLMETGGFKGRTRVVARDDLYRALEERLGIPTRRMVNEYGMTELLSQMYEPVLREQAAAENRRHVAPPWLRIRALDPETLQPVAAGDPGLLAFFDLANAGSVSAILTEDLGRVESDGLRLLGRTPGAEPRGCSLALESLLRANR